MKIAARYVAHFEYLRRAAFVIARRDGPGALTRRGLAAELRMSDATVRRLVDPESSLAGLAAGDVERRRREALWRLRPPRRCHSETRDDADVESERRVETIRSLLPDAATLDAEVVWWRLALAHAVIEPAHDLLADLDLDERPEPSADGDRALRSAVARERSAAERARHREQVAPFVQSHREAGRVLVGRLGAPPGEAVVLWQALVDGLALAACLGELDPAEARDLLARVSTPRPGRRRADVVADMPDHGGADATGGMEHRDAG